jgi:hypothetical protein
MTGQPNSNQPVDDIRKQLRNQILQAKPETRTLKLFGAEVELRQPTLKAIMGYQSAEDRGRAGAEMIQRYLYVPGTTTPVFEEADIDSILNLPFGEDMQKLQAAINELTNVAEEIDTQVGN